MGAEFFSRADCPLCEDWWQGIAEWPVQVQYRDIDANLAWRARYGWRVPVLRLKDGREFDLAVPGEPERCLTVLRATATATQPI